MSQPRHLSNSGRRMYSVKNINSNPTSEYADPIYLSETYSKLLNQIHNLRKEVDPLVMILQRLQEQLDPEFNDPTINQGITQKIASLQAQQYEIDDKISQVRRQYSNEVKEKLDMELNEYRVELNESRFDLNETNKMINQVKIELQKVTAKGSSTSKKYIFTQNQINQMNNKLNSLRQEGSQLKQKYMNIIYAKQSYYDQIDNLNNILTSVQNKNEKKKLELYKIRVSYENRKKNLIAQIQSNIKRKNKPQLAIKQEPNLNSNFNKSLRRISTAPSKRTIPDKSKKVQIIPGLVKNVHSYNFNTSGGSTGKNIQQKELDRCKTPRRDDEDTKSTHHHHHSKPGLSLSTSASPNMQPDGMLILPPTQPSKAPSSRHHKLHFSVADSSVKIVKMQKNNDECNDFISFS